MALDWSVAKFSAFAGLGKLDATFLKHNIDPETQKPDLDADVATFYSWLNNLRTDPAACGIMPIYVDQVNQLLQDFFPLSPDGKSVTILRIRDQEVAGGRSRANPSQVLFGSNQYPLEIVDASTALGYIFSVAKPTVDVPTWQNYYLPLLVLLCRCLYLAFIYQADGDQITTSLADVPRRCCVMYVGGSARPQRYFFAGEVPTASNHIGDDEVQRQAQVAMLDTWRRSAILDPAIKQVPLDAGEAAPTIPEIDPRFRQQLANELFRGLTQNAILDEACTIIWTTLSATFISQYLAEPPQGKVPPIPLRLTRLIGHKTIGTMLNNLLLSLIDLRWDSDTQGSQLDKAFIAFFNSYLTPHTFLPPDLTFTTETPEPSAFGKVRDAAVLTFWGINRATAVGVLDALFAVYEKHRLQPLRPFGRCAETYCITSLLTIRPNYFMWLGESNPSMSDIRGIALNVLDVGGSLSFQNAFTSVELQKASTGGPFSRPCENCNVLLPLYKAGMSDAVYNADLVSIMA